MTTPRHVPAGSLPWIPLDGGPASFRLLRLDPQGPVTTLTRFPKGCQGAFHTHPGGEELYVIEGDATIGGHRLRAGDYLETPAGAGHQVEAHEETLLLVMLPKPPVYAAR